MQLLLKSIILLVFIFPVAVKAQSATQSDSLLNKLIGKWTLTGTIASVDQFFESAQNICAKFFPWAIYIGTNGNVEMFVIDKRNFPYQFGLLPFIANDNDFISLGNTFEKFVERLYNDTAFENQ
ncbi:hypothetical protein [Arachidicoccus ginsenosidimutans]|uniref:hypothetical protein n=1 Tax=Arachidicoccus sp. BS20 TaxID=1850526 RepID=UPI0012E7502F|nr:hypothetical protein [Arachidicoccus sp. BS20]